MADEPVASSSITVDIRCQECGYNLRGLPKNGNCPECGLPLSETLYFNEPDVQEAYATWYGRIRGGVDRLCIGFTFVALLMAFGPDRGDLSVFAVEMACVIGGIVLLASGTIRLSAVPPVQRTCGVGAFCRTGMQWSLVLSGLGLALAFATESPVLVMLPVAVTQSLSVIYCGDLAGRLNAPVRRYLCGVAGTAVICACIAPFAVDLPQDIVRLLWVAAYGFAAASLGATGLLFPRRRKPAYRR